MNTMEYAKIFQTALDKQAIVGATSGWMEGNAGLVVYNGGDEIKIPKIAMDGLGNYDRDAGFNQGSVTFNYETLKFTQDRGRSFSLDAMSVNETNFVATAGAVMSEFQRTKVIPEIDAYRYSKVAQLAITGGQALGGYTPTDSDILKKLRADIATVQDIIGEVPLIITLPTPIKSLLEGSQEISKQLDVMDFASADGSVSFKVKAIDGCPLMGVPSIRMLTKYIYNDGKTAGQIGGGFVPDASAKHINWLLTAMDAPIGVSKTDVIRIFDPLSNQSANAWKFDYRKYHDVWLPDNKVAKTFVNIKEAL